MFSWSPHQLRRGGYFKGQKTFEAMIQVLSQVSKSENIITLSSNHKMIQSPKTFPEVKLAAEPCSGHGPMLRLLVNIHHFVVRIDKIAFECSAFPFVLKSSFFRDSIQTFKNSASNLCATPEIALELPGGRYTFEAIRIFCYDSRVTITNENVLNLLAASTALGFTEDVAPENLFSQCRRFIAEVSVTSILSILKNAPDLKIDTENEFGLNLLITKLAQHALALQNSPDVPASTREIVELISELRFLHPRIVDAALRAFRCLEVHLVDFWCTELPTNLDVLLSSDDRNGRSIFTYFSEALDARIAAGGVHLDKLDPEKLVMVLNPGVMTRPIKSGDTIPQHLASKLSELNLDVVQHLDPRVLTELVSRAVTVIPHAMPHLAEMVDRALALESPWDGSRDAMDRFIELAECVARESHDMLYDAVERFSQSCTQEEAEDVWNLIDIDMLSEPKFEAAVESICQQNRKHYFARLLRRAQANRLSLKRKLNISVPVEEEEPRRKSERMSPSSVFVRALDGSTYSLEVEPGATVDSIRDAIEKRLQRFERFWWPVYRGRKLLMSRTVASYGIEKDCTLSMKVLLVDEHEMEVWPTTSDATDSFVSDTPCVCGCK